MKWFEYQPKRPLFLDANRYNYQLQMPITMRIARIVTTRRTKTLIKY